MDDVVEGAIAERMDKYLDLYILFRDLCRSKSFVYDDEIPMLWAAYCEVT